MTEESEASSQQQRIPGRIQEIQSKVAEELKQIEQDIYDNDQTLIETPNSTLSQYRDYQLSLQSPHTQNAQAERLPKEQFQKKLQSRSQVKDHKNQMLKLFSLGSLNSPLTNINRVALEKINERAEKQVEEIMQKIKSDVEREAIEQQLRENREIISINKKQLYPFEISREVKPFPKKTLGQRSKKKKALIKELQKKEAEEQAKLKKKRKKGIRFSHIKSPDFSRSCMKCLREVCLKKDETKILLQVQKDILHMNHDFKQMKEEFGIKNNIKEEYCCYTGAKLKHFLQSLDLKYEQNKKKLEEQIQKRLLVEMDYLEKFSKEFDDLSAIISKHQVVDNRSLFQAFSDNLIYPAQIENHYMNLHSFDSPKILKQKFAEFLSDLDKLAAKEFEETFQCIIESLDPESKSLKLKEVQKKSRLTANSQDENQKVPEEKKQEEEEDNGIDYYTYGETQEVMKKEVKENIKKKRGKKKTIDLIPEPLLVTSLNPETRPRYQIITQNPTQQNETQSVTLDDLLNPNAVLPKHKQIDYFTYQQQAEQKTCTLQEPKSTPSLFAQYFQEQADQRIGPDHLETQRDCDNSLADLIRNENSMFIDETLTLFNGMNSQERKQKQDLARTLNNLANNALVFKTTKECFYEGLLEALSVLRKPEVVMVDINENRAKKDLGGFIFFDTQAKIIVHSLTMIYTTRCFLQVVNSEDKVFLIERTYTHTKNQIIKVYVYERKDGVPYFLFEEKFDKILRPVCSFYNGYLFVVVVGCKSIVYNSHMKLVLTFATLNFQASNNNDIKSCFLNESLYLIHCSKSKVLGEIFQIDLKTLHRWKRVDLKGDTRPKDLIMYGIMPYRKEGRDLALLFGGAYNTLRQCFLFDEKCRDIVRCSIYAGDQDRIHTNQLWEMEEEIIAFGRNKVHIFDKNKGTLESKCYDFEYEDESGEEEAGGVGETGEVEEEEEEDEESQQHMVRFDDVLENIGSNIDDLLIP